MASHGSPTWTGAIRGTAPEAEIIGAAAYLLHNPPSDCSVHVGDASIIGVHLRRGEEALYPGDQGAPTHQHLSPLGATGRPIAPLDVSGVSRLLFHIPLTATREALQLFLASTPTQQPSE